MRSLSDLSVCFLAGTLGQGGAERQLYYMLRALRHAGAQVTLLTLTRGEHWEPRIEELGVPIHFVGQSPSRFARCKEISRRVKSLQPDIVHSQHFYTNLYAVAAARWARSREVGSLRSDVLHELAAHSFAIGRASLRLPRMLTVNSRNGRANALRLGVAQVRIRLLPNAVCREGLTAAPRASSDEFSVCFVGRLTQLKRCDVFLASMAAMRARVGRPLKGVIVGDGPDRPRLEARAKELGLMDSCVTFAGAVEDPGPYYAMSDVLLLTSDWEGTPNVILEAMAAGLPVVATDVGGVPELVRHGETGYLAPAGDADALARHLLALAGDSDLRTQFGQAARRIVAQDYSFDALRANLEDVYNAALA